MMSIHQYEAKKRVARSRRNAEVESQTVPPPKEDCDLRLVDRIGRVYWGCWKETLPSTRSPILLRSTTWFSWRNSISMVKPYCFKALSPMLHKSSKPHSKSSNGRSYSIRYTPQTLSTVPSFPLSFEPNERCYLPTTKKTAKTGLADRSDGTGSTNNREGEQLVSSNGEYIIN